MSIVGIRCGGRNREMMRMLSSFSPRQRMKMMGASSVSSLRNTISHPLSFSFSSYSSSLSSTTTTTTLPGSSRSISNINNNHGHNDHERLIVIGSGVAGCTSALIAAETHKIPVTLLCAGSKPTDCNSYWAQGGIIYRNYDSSSGDSAESLMEDIHRAGAGLCHDPAVQKVANDGPGRVRQLLLGNVGGKGRFASVPFDRREDGSLSCCLEASHAAARIIHYADQTGAAITDHITRAAMDHPLIQLVTDSIVTDLIVEEDTASTSTDAIINADNNTQRSRKVCMGVSTFNRTTNQIQNLYGTYGTVLASGGLGGIYAHSTNPSGFNALGSSVALALRGGASCSDLEYVQFHPTALYIPDRPRFLLTEALRGEGAILRDASGRAFAQDFHADGELAPRDIVARGVFAELQKSQTEHNVFLDITHRDPTWLKQRFPSINAHLSQHNLDLSKDPLPITPAAHYTCGGVTTNTNGCTDLLNLYAAGESARTGLHGGNRLASTSLLEGLVYGASVADYVANPQSHEGRELTKELLYGSSSPHTSQTSFSSLPPSTSSEQQRVHDLLSKLKNVMWDDVGVIRTPDGLRRAIHALQEIREEANHLYDKSLPTVESIGLRDAAMAGEAVAIAAQENQVSAGAHYMKSVDGNETKHHDDDDDDDNVSSKHHEEDEDATSDVMAAAN